MADATVRDHSAAIGAHFEEPLPRQTPQTVGVNPDAPAQRSASGDVAKGIGGYPAYLGFC
ncbi:hypothetical protein [Actinoallomurus sp. NPDC052274]|uniref:hypothetical protein n=1 Tax=Actinoallomurus sp. NPDC052274 TaxID=3155420 RepID=UPI003412D054